MRAGPGSQRCCSLIRVCHVHQAAQSLGVICYHDETLIPGPVFEVKNSPHGILVQRVAAQTEAEFSGIGDHPAAGDTTDRGRQVPC